MEEDRRRDGGGEVYRPADQEEGGSNSDAAPPTSGGLPIGSSPLVLPRSALGRIVQRRHGGRQGGVRINPYRQWERGWRVWNVEETGTSPIAEPAELLLGLMRLTLGPTSRGRWRFSGRGTRRDQDVGDRDVD